MQKENTLKIKFNSNLLAIILICILGIVAYSNTFQSPFHFDDQLNVVLNPAVKNLTNLNALWAFWPTRFVTFFTFALNSNISGLNVFGYHVFNFAIHLISTLLVFWLVWLTFKTPEVNHTKISHFSQSIALFTSLIFLLHPIQTEAVTYIYQRCTGLAGLFYILSLCLYIKSRFLLNAEDKNLKWLIYFIFSCLTCVAAMFTKENTITLPIMIIFYEYCFFKRKRLVFSFFYLIFLPLIPVIFLYYKIINFSVLKNVIGTHISIGDYFFTQLRVVVTYLRLLFLPINQNFDYDYSISTSLLDFRVIFSLFIIFITLFTALRIFKKYKLLSFGIFWFFITLIVESSFISLDDLIYEHRLYLPMVGFGLFLAGSFFYLVAEKRLKAGIFILSAIIIAMLVLTYNRNMVWKDGISLWSDAIKKSPHKARSYNERAIAYAEKKDFVNAISDLNMAIQFDPKYANAYNNLGNAYFLQGKVTLAIKYFTKAIESYPDYASAYYNLANAYGVAGDFNEAIKNYTLALKINPNFVQAYNNRAYYLFFKKENAMALKNIQKAKELGYSFNPVLFDQLNNRE